VRDVSECGGLSSAELRAEITERAKLMQGMVGWLYTSILADQIATLERMVEAADEAAELNEQRAEAAQHRAENPSVPWGERREDEDG
jgi:hypothetical protein